MLKWNSARLYKSFLLELLVFTAYHPHPPPKTKIPFFSLFSLFSFLFSLWFLSFMLPLFLSFFLDFLQKWTTEFLSSPQRISSAERLLIHERLHGRRSFTDSRGIYKDNVDTNNSPSAAWCISLLGPYFHAAKSDFSPGKQCRSSKQSEEEEETETEAIKWKNVKILGRIRRERTRKWEQLGRHRDLGGKGESEKKWWERWKKKGEMVTACGHRKLAKWVKRKQNGVCMCRGRD